MKRDSYILYYFLETMYWDYLLVSCPPIKNSEKIFSFPHYLHLLHKASILPRTRLLMAALDASNNFPEAHLRSLDVQSQATPNSAPDQSSQEPSQNPKLLDQDASTTKASTTGAAAIDMAHLHVRHNARKGLTSHFHLTVSTFKDTLLVDSPQINPLIKRILLAQGAYANSSDDSDAFRKLLSGESPSRKHSTCESEPSSSGSHHVDKEISAAAENISTLPHLLKTESHAQREKTCLELPTNEFIEKRGGAFLKAIDIMPLSVIQTEDSPDCISEGEEEDFTIDDATEERHAIRMEELREQNEQKGKRNSLSASHHARTHAHAHAHTNNGKHNRVFE